MELLKFSRLSIISLMIISFLSSCWHWLYIALDEGNAKLSSTIKYDGDTTDISAYINVDGFYCIMNYKSEPDTIDDAVLEVLYFFRDGTYTENYGLYSNTILKSDTLSNMFIYSSSWNKGKEWEINGGIYKINNNIIISEVYSTFFYGWDIYRKYYKIINRSNILYYKFEFISNGKEISSREMNYFYTFVPAINLPSPDDTMIKHKKWLWKDKKAYKRWKEEYKKTRKKNKK